MKDEKGFDARLKPPDTVPYHPSACVKLILRNVRSRSNNMNMPPAIFPTWPNPDKFWCAVQTRWLPGLSAQRGSMMRSHPDTLDDVLAPEHAELRPLDDAEPPRHPVVIHLLGFVETHLAQIRQELEATAGSKRHWQSNWHRNWDWDRDWDREKKREQCTNLICMQKLLTWRKDKVGGQKKSTLWNPANPRRNLLSPEDILTSECSCARGEKFHWHLSVDCPGGFLAFAPTTYFEKVEQVIPALLHAAKGRLLSSLRASPVY